jgi:hypothetical protein
MAAVGCLRGDFAGLCSGCLLRGGLQAIEKRLREGDICTALDLEGIPDNAPIKHAHRPAQNQNVRLGSGKLQGLVNVGHDCGGGWLGQAAG